MCIRDRFRDEDTLEPHVYFCKMPKDIADRDIIIVDPMLATGGSADAAISEMKKRGCKMCIRDRPSASSGRT